MWIYVFGEVTGADIKIGHTKEPYVLRRLKIVNGEANRDRYVLLAAVHSQTSGETEAKSYFTERGLLREDKNREEYFWPRDEIVEWILWLRQQWYVSFDSQDDVEDAHEEHFSSWVPQPERRTVRPPEDPSRLIQDEQRTGHLAGTAWAWMPDMTASFQDYFTDPKIVARAIEAMGGIDGDAASHWLAQKRLRKAGVVIPEYLHTNKSAFSHEWFDRTWLNPPYGENDRWFRRAIEMIDAGKTTQLCMLSPIYVFTTGIAEEIMRRSSAAIILSPTPKFYNPAFPTGYDPVTGKSKDGTNLPHAIIYWGPRRQEFLSAFAGTGIPVVVSWTDMETAHDLLEEAAV
jgi:hypothetical protein